MPAVPHFGRCLVATAATVARAALDLVLPPVCLTCDRPVSAPGQFCPECFQRTAFLGEPCCAVCGVPFRTRADGGADGLCPGCRMHPPPWECARAALRYDAQARRLLLPFKHADRPELAAALAPMMARAGAVLLRRAGLLVPVPLHRRRLFARRYNQASLLADALGRRAGLPVCRDALRRTRPTAPLGELGASARAEALAGAIAVRPGRVARLVGRRVLLVDDVMTSGATASACTCALLQAGAAAVDVLAAARVPDPRMADPRLPG
jgi:ComF family protein